MEGGSMKRNIVMALALIVLFLPVVVVGGQSSSTSDGSSSPASPLVTTSALYSALTSAQRLTQGGNLSDQEIWGSMMAVGYVAGVQETLSHYLAQPNYRVCVPQGVRADAIARIVTKFVDSHPEAYGWPPGGTVAAALIQAFPCKKRSAPSAN